MSNSTFFHAGIAYRGGACTVNMKQQLVEAVGLVEDNGGYLGIVPAAHEIGHLYVIINIQYFYQYFS